MPLYPEGRSSINNWKKHGHWNKREGKVALFELRVEKLKGDTVIASDHADIIMKTSSKPMVTTGETVYGFGTMAEYDEGFFSDELILNNVQFIKKKEFDEANRAKKLNDSIVAIDNDPESSQNINNFTKADAEAQKKLDPGLYNFIYYKHQKNPSQLKLATATDNYDSQKYMLHALNFDLETIISIIEKGDFKDYKELEAKINSEESGINNVDIDQDNKVDYIGIEESKKGDKRHLSFVAFPSSKPKDKSLHIVVAQISLSKPALKGKKKPTEGEQEEVEVEGGYPDYVDGGDSFFYRNRYYIVGGGLFATYMWYARRNAYRKGWNDYKRYHKMRSRRSLRNIRRARTTYRSRSGFKSMSRGSRVSVSSRPKAFAMTSKRARASHVKKSRKSYSKLKSTRSVRSKGRSSRSRGSRRGK